GGRAEPAEIEPRDQCPPLDLRDVAAGATRALEPLVRNVGLAIDELMPGERPRKTHREEKFAPRRPAARLAPAGQRAVGAEADRGPGYLARVIVEARAQVEHEMRGLATLECVAMHADPR